MKYQSELCMVCHQEAEALFAVGAITEEEMREFDEACLVREPEPDVQFSISEHWEIGHGWDEL